LTPIDPCITTVFFATVDGVLNPINKSTPALVTKISLSVRNSLVDGS